MNLLTPPQPQTQTQNTRQLFRTLSSRPPKKKPNICKLQNQPTTQTNQQVQTEYPLVKKFQTQKAPNYQNDTIHNIGISFNKIDDLTCGGIDGITCLANYNHIYLCITTILAPTKPSMKKLIKYKKTKKKEKTTFYTLSIAKKTICH